MFPLQHTQGIYAMCALIMVEPWGDVAEAMEAERRNDQHKRDQDPSSHDGKAQSIGMFRHGLPTLSLRGN